MGENTVDEEFDKFNRASEGAKISRVSYVVATNGDTCLVSGVAFLKLDLANNVGVGDSPAALDWDLVIMNGEEGVSRALDMITSIETSANALA